jgi:hypothetical protein
MKRGDGWLLSLDSASGHKQKECRPVLMLAEISPIFE